MADNGVKDPLNARGQLATSTGSVTIYQLKKLAEHGGVDLSKLPFTVKILLENLLRHCDGYNVTEDDVLKLARWTPDQAGANVVAFLPGRVLMQDLTGIPAVVDLAAMREAMVKLGGDPKKINPLVPADLVIDHSVQIDRFGSNIAFAFNVKREYERNAERYAFLRWAQQAFDNLRIVPPGTGICHQVNLEYLATVVMTSQEGSETVAFPDTVVGTDSHTVMVNGLGVLGWGVGGIEAEAVMLNQPIDLLTPEVIGVRLTGALPEGATATDLVLTVTQILRKKGVVNKFVEFTGPGVSQLSLPDRATLSNMAPEYGATAGLFPVDVETLRYLRLTGRSEAQVDLVERYAKEQGLFRTDDAPEPVFNDVVALDLGTIEPSMAGPNRPEGRVPLAGVGQNFTSAFADRMAGKTKSVELEFGKTHAPLFDGSVAIAAISSCTNTSNPSVLLAAGLLAKKAVERGLHVSPAVKTSLAPGSNAVDEYLERAELLPSLEALGFHIVGHGCTTCIGNSGPLLDQVTNAIQSEDLTVAAVLSGNRNFDGRIHPNVRAQYLASPPLVVAFALAGTVNIDMAHDPIGQDPNGQDVFLKDIWPTNAEIQAAMDKAVQRDVYEKSYSNVLEGDEQWTSMPVPQGDLYKGDPSSTYVQIPPYFDNLQKEPAPFQDIIGARALAVLGDSITTDHISPASAIPKDSPAGKFLMENGVQPLDFNSYGARRGNDRVMVRGTFGSIRLKNKLTPDLEGDWTIHQPDGEVMRIFDASAKYKAEGTPLVVLGGKDYGNGSSRDWAAKGPMLLGVKAVLVETMERIHRSNLVGMGLLPLQFLPGQNAASLGLTGHEVFDITGIAQGLTPGQELQVKATAPDGKVTTFNVSCRIQTPAEIKYYQHGGILNSVLLDVAAES